MRIVLIIQARSNSSRLPNKVLLDLANNINVIQHMYNRIKNCKMIDDIIVATTYNPEDKKLYDYCLKNDIKCYRGSEMNALERFYQTAYISNADKIIRCTGDCPLIDSNLIDSFVSYSKNKNHCLFGVAITEGFPDGFDMEIFTFDLLKKAYKEAKTEFDKEHVSSYIRRELLNNKCEYFKIELNKENYQNINFDKLHLSLDTIGDYKLIKNIFNNLYNSNNNFSYIDVLIYLNNNSDVFKLQENKNENIGAKLFLEAKNISDITSLLSKKSEIILPKNWPFYYKKANGIEVTTLDGVKLKDYGDGFKNCILGYADPDVNNSVQQSVSRGNVSTLNSPSEIELSKLLLEIHPWAEMVSYNKGSEEDYTLSLKIGNISSGKNKIAFCGYCGWYEWYLKNNVNLPLLQNNVFTFNYNKFEELLKITENHDIGCIIMEPARLEDSKDNFLEKIRNLCDKKNIILIFDEINSAFRLNSGGLHLRLGVNPDIALFGKALGNGYPLTAIIGKKKYMKDILFTRNTFFTDDISFTSTIAMIKKHKELNIGAHIEEIGLYFQSELRRIIDKIDIKLQISGLPCFTYFKFNYENELTINTLFIKKMLERNILAKNSFYLSYAHKKIDIDFYIENIEEVLKELKYSIDNNLISI